MAEEAARTLAQASKSPVGEADSFPGEIGLEVRSWTEGAKATFFRVGERAQAHQSSLRAMTIAPTRDTSRETTPGRTTT